jgi:DNA-binding MarR family transcriptional regulator
MSSPPLPPRLEDRIGYLLAVTHGGIRGMGEPTLIAETGFGVKAYGLMAALAALDEPPSQQALGSMMRVDRTTMVQTIDPLEERGYVERTPNPRDRRERLLVLTADGRKALRKANAVVNRFEEEFLAPLSEDERDELRRLLRTLAAHHGAAPKGA